MKISRISRTRNNMKVGTTDVLMIHERSQGGKQGYYRGFVRINPKNAKVCSRLGIKPGVELLAQTDQGYFVRIPVTSARTSWKTMRKMGSGRFVSL